MPDPSFPLARRAPHDVVSVVAALNALQDHGFIKSWRHYQRRWYVTGGATYGPYSGREIFGFVEGCRCMGANV